LNPKLTYQRVGIGVDIVEISRVKRLMSKDIALFLDYLCTPVERSLINTAAISVRLIATIIAVKEATLKAVGMGLPDQSWWRQIEIDGLPGTPKSTMLMAKAQKATDYSIRKPIETSVCSTRDMVIAMAMAFNIGRNLSESRSK
jgi:holo-[acyl-carrier-protein] synthase